MCAVRTGTNALPDRSLRLSRTAATKRHSASVERSVIAMPLNDDGAGGETS